jgi:hypothetical protein
LAMNQRWHANSLDINQATRKVSTENCDWYLETGNNSPTTKSKPGLISWVWQLPDGEWHSYDACFDPFGRWISLMTSIPCYWSLGVGANTGRQPQQASWCRQNSFNAFNASTKKFSMFKQIRVIIQHV